MGEWKKSACNMCAQHCGMELEIENDRIVSARPDPDNPRTRGYCCRKARAVQTYHHNEDRLNTPLKKVGDKHVPISWEQALSEIGEKLNGILAQHGPRSTAVVGCTLASAQGDLYMAQALMGLIGTQNYYSPIGLEFMGVWWSHGKIIGRQSGTIPDEHRSEVLVVWGCNAYVSHQMNRARVELREISENPDKMLITVDPRLSETARMSDKHVMLRPGSDSLLIRAMIALIMKEGWQDQAYMDKWVSDYDQVKHWFDDVDIEESCRVCGVPYEEVREFCRILTTRHWSLHQDLGIYMGRHNTLSSYLLLILCAVCGKFLVPGGTVLSSGFLPLGPSGNDETTPGVWHTLVGDWSPVMGAYPTGALPEEIMNDHPDRLRAVITSKSNPVRAYQDVRAQEEAFSQLELLVCIDIVMTETARLAHYVLPGCTPYEGYDFCVFQQTYPEAHTQLKQPVVSRPAERREDAEAWLGIIDGMGLIPEIPASLYEAAEKKSRMAYFAELMAWLEENPSYKPAALPIVGKTMGKAMNSATAATLWFLFVTSPLVPMRAANAGFTPSPTLADDLFGQVLAHPEGVLVGKVDLDNTFAGIAHPDGKLHFFTPLIDDYIQNITPEKEARALALTNEFPLLISSGTHADGGVNGVMRNPASYKHRRPWKVQINPEDAEAYGIRDGQMVRVSTEAGSVEVEAEYTYRAGKGYLQLPHHYGFNFRGEVNGVPANQVVPRGHMDTITGNPLMRYVPCRVEAV